MGRKAVRRWLKIFVVAVALFAIGWLFSPYAEVGMTGEIGARGADLSEYDISAIPRSVIDDADKLAQELFGADQEKCQEYAHQLLASYAEARDRDVVIVFNSGGWGGNLLEETPGWDSILDGIKFKLEGLGYQSLLLNYQRTASGLRACFNEFIQALTNYPQKARDLAERVEFLTDHITDLKVIVAGESTGTVVTDNAMSLLQDNTRVYSIQTGTPFWHKPTTLTRTLLMNSNGKTVDTFSYGNVPAVLWANLKSWLGLASEDENPGSVLSWLRAPGHHYSWQYPGVCSEVNKFLDENFGEKES